MKEKLHTLDHILFTVINNICPAKTKSIQFTSDSCRVDYECNEDLRKYENLIEEEMNKIISKNCKVISYVMEREKAKEIADIGLLPNDLKEINIYEIEGVNKLACVGPHVKNTSEIGMLKILSLKKNGRNTFSIKFTCT